MLTDTKKSIELIKRAQNIVLVPPKNVSGDIIGSAFALFSTLSKLGKNANILLDEIPQKFDFLSCSQNSTIVVNSRGKEIEEVRYEKNENDLKIHLSLKNGQVLEEDIKTLCFDIKAALLTDPSQIPLSPDLVITIGVKSREETKYFEEKPGLLYDSPILNIDTQIENEGFGEANLVETSSLSLCEILFELFSALTDDLGWEIIDKETATFLLTGLIAGSQNFQSPRTRPKTLKTAASLIEKGADHQKIVQNLYKEREIQQLRLLGKVLENLEFDQAKEVHTACLRDKDLQEANALAKDFGAVIEELRFNFWKIPSLAILWESHASPPLVKGLFYSSKKDYLQKATEAFESAAHKEGVVFLIRDPDLNTAKNKFLETISN